jgi:hypothetical protein
MVFALELLVILLQKPEFQVAILKSNTIIIHIQVHTQSQMTYKHILKFTYRHIQSQFTVTINIDIAIYNYIMFMHMHIMFSCSHKFNIYLQQK